MEKFKDVRALLGRKIECSCGRTHETVFSRLIMERGALKKLPELLQELGVRRPSILADTHTWEAAGSRVAEILGAQGIAFSSFVLKSPETGDLPADEKTFGTAAIAMDPGADLVISVGTGTINDTGRYLSFLAKIPFILVATAPSMDGMVSNVAPLIFNKMKVTFQAHAPLALVCDLDILTASPIRMIAAGAGDIFGKYNCLTDWELSHLINGEYYCSFIADLMREAVRQTDESTDGLLERREDAVEKLTGALVLAGVAMGFAKISRPASGAEHHMSHFWEMQYLFDGRPAVLHGTKVGIGTILALDLYNHLAESEKPDFDMLRKTVRERQSKEEWSAEIRRAYRDAAEGILDLEEKSGKNDPEKLLKRLDVIEEHWDEIRALAAAVPKASGIYEKLEKLDAPRRPADIGLSPEYVHDAVRYAKELRDRYTILQLLWDIGRLDEEADRIVKKYC
ncbi:MAG: sn-glycerol-1-phosphate dehydrogenase [Lachnospiraceae bacterium]|nr:sn-glycerol-1-phosphate dehydrogenase [Lachnospiraceae bacterium]